MQWHTGTWHKGVVLRNWACPALPLPTRDPDPGSEAAGRLGRLLSVASFLLGLAWGPSPHLPSLHLPRENSGSICPSQKPSSFRRTAEPPTQAGGRSGDVPKADSLTGWAKLEFSALSNFLNFLFMFKEEVSTSSAFGNVVIVFC